jgi:hypothetical protein
LKKSRLHLGFEKKGIVFGIIAAIISTQPVSARVLMGGGTYAQNFDSPANRGAANPRTDKVTLPDTHSTFSTSFAPRQACLRPRSVILLCATSDLSHRLPDFPRLAIRQQPFRVNPSLNPNSEVAGGGGADKTLSECARPRAQQLASFEPRNISQPPAHLAWLRPGRPHSANAEIQLRSSG